jgi:drug/metabolite transporter (DMT)-like permease
LQKIERRHYKIFVLLTLFEPFLYFLGESVGLQYVSSSLGAIVISTIPLFMPFAAYYFLKERLSKWNFLGIIISLSGVLLVIFSGNHEVSGAVTGILIMLIAVVSAIFYNVILIRLTKHYSVFTIITYQNGLGAIYFLPVFFIFEYNHFQQVEFSIGLLTPLLELSLLASGFAFIFFTLAMKKLGVSKANVFINLIPVFTAVFAYFMLDEPLGFIKLAGIGLVISGLFLSQLRLKK